MNNQNTDNIFTADNFRQIDLNTILATAQKKDIFAGYQIEMRLRDASKKCMAAGEDAKARILISMADACSMMMRPNNIDDPFSPCFIGYGKRSAQANDFSEQEIVFFSEIAEKCEISFVRARLADLAWVRMRDHKSAIRAIDAYREFPVSDYVIWRTASRDCWKRAFEIARKLGKNESAHEKLEQMESALIARMEMESDLIAHPKQDEKAVNASCFLISDLAHFFFCLGLGKKDSKKIAVFLETSGHKLESNQDSQNAAETFRIAHDWHNREENQAKAAEMMKKCGAIWLALANCQPPERYPVAANFYHKALLAYQSIPQKRRLPLGINDNTLDEIQKKAHSSRARFRDDMSTVQSQEVDISSIVERAKKEVEGKSYPEAIAAFLFLIYPTENLSKIRESAEESIKNSPLRQLFSEWRFGSGDRIVASRKPSYSTENTGQASEEEIKREMIDNYRALVLLIVHSTLLPALDQITLEHHIRESDILEICAKQPITPDRLALIAKGIYNGIQRDFVTAAHLLIPQVENMVRQLLKTKGANTIYTDPATCVETEKGLGALLVDPKIEEVFSPSQIFEMNVLFADADGFNLRNNIAHGLLGDMEFGEEAVYAWWLSFRLFALHAFAWRQRETAADDSSRS